jgi:magnesium-transporting ATPase (P-type)
MLYSYYPKIYFISQKNKLFSKLIFFAWFFLGMCQGIICLILTLYAIGDENDTSGQNSYEIGLYLVEISVYTSVIIVVTIKIAVNVKTWSPILVIGFLVPSLGLYFVWTFLQGFVEEMVSYHSIINLLTMPSFYAIQILCVGGMFAFDFLLFSLKTTKESFENYLKYRTLRNRRLSEGNLKKYMVEMYESREKALSL